MRRVFPVLLALTLLGCPALARAEVLPPVKHVFVIVLENSDFGTNFPSSGAPQAPYLAKTLTARGQLLTKYYGTSHVSLGNYISMVSGQAPNPDTQSDCIPQYRDVFPGIAAPDFGQVVGSGCVYPKAVLTIADQLQAKGLTWRGYMEDMGGDDPNDPANTAGGTRDTTTRPGQGNVRACGHPVLGTTDGTQTANATDQYATRHNPFMYFHSIIDDDPRCVAHVVNLQDHLSADLASTATTPNFSFITPDLCSDGHDSGGCADGKRPGGLASVDEFLKQWVPQITGSPAFADGGALIITWDEGSVGPNTSENCCGEQAGYNTAMPGVFGPGGGRTGTVVISPFTVPGSVNETPYNHYALLRSEENLFGLSYLGYAAPSTLKAFGVDVFAQAPTVDLSGPSGGQTYASSEVTGTGVPGGGADGQSPSSTPTVVNPCRIVRVADQGRNLRPGSLVSALRVERPKARSPRLVVVASRRTRVALHVRGVKASRHARTRACAPVRLPLGSRHGRATLSLSVRGKVERRTVIF
jgi:hypothetical protein